MASHIQKLFKTSRPFQIWSFIGIVALGSVCLYTINRFPPAFLLLIASLLLLYYTPWPTRAKWWTGAAMLLVVIPLAASGTSSQSSYMELASTICIYAIMALGMNIIVGFTGLLDLGFLAFFAFGSYTYAILASPHATKLFGAGAGFSGQAFWLLLFAGAALAFMAGSILGLPVLRVHGDYLAIVTLGFGEIVRLMAQNLDKPVNITNGAKGIPLVHSPQLGSVVLDHANQLYFIALGLLALTIFVILRLEHSPIGRAWKSIRENEIAAQAMGVPIVRMKLLAFAFGACFSGLAGVMYVAKIGYIDPTSFSLPDTILILIMVVLGGMGSLPGVILGATVISVINFQILPDLTEFLQRYLDVPAALSPEKMQKMLFAILLICVVRFRPKGLIPARNRFYPPPPTNVTTTMTTTESPLRASSER